MPSVPSIEEFAAVVRQRARRNDPVDRVAVAIQLSSELAGLGDAVVSQFVDEARAEGCSWASIGDAMGVSKQGAQQRFVTRLFRTRSDSASPFSLWTPRARKAVELAQEEASGLRHNYVGTEHLLLGVLREPDGIGGKALRKLRVKTATVRKAVVDDIGRGHSAPAGGIPFTPRSKKALEMTRREARNMGHNYVGTEHLAIALATLEPDALSRKLLAAQDVTADAIRAEVVRLLSR